MTTIILIFYFTNHNYYLISCKLEELTD